MLLLQHVLPSLSLTIAKGVCSCFRHQHQVKMDAMVLILQKGGIPDHGRVVVTGKPRRIVESAQP